MPAHMHILSGRSPHLCTGSPYILWPVPCRRRISVQLRCIIAVQRSQQHVTLRFGVSEDTRGAPWSHHGHSRRRFCLAHRGAAPQQSYWRASNQTAAVCCAVKVMIFLQDYTLVVIFTSLTTSRAQSPQEAGFCMTAVRIAVVVGVLACLYPIYTSTIFDTMASEGVGAPTTPTVAPYGEWLSPITSAAIVAGGQSLALPAPLTLLPITCHRVSTRFHCRERASHQQHPRVLA